MKLGAGERDFRYSASSEMTEAGIANIKLEKKTPANLSHYIIGAAIIAAVVYFASVKLDD